MERSCCPVSASFVKREMILATLTTPPASMELVAGMPIRDPPQDSGSWGTNNRAIGPSRSSSPGDSLSRVNLEGPGWLVGWLVFIKLGVEDNYFQAVQFPR